MSLLPTWRSNCEDQCEVHLAGLSQYWLTISAECSAGQESEERCNS